MRNTNYYYYCADCDIAWEDEWECGCDDECPGCGRDFTPFDSEEERDAAMPDSEA